MPDAPDDAIVTSYGSISQMPPRPTLMVVSKSSMCPDVSTKPPCPSEVVSTIDAGSMSVYFEKGMV